MRQIKRGMPVLVSDDTRNGWDIDIFMYKSANKSLEFRYRTYRGLHKYCIPYYKNKSLLTDRNGLKELLNDF